VTIVTGRSGYNEPAARRLAEILVPWGVASSIVQADDVNKPRQIPQAAAATWVGLGFGRVDPKKPRIEHVGFAVDALRHLVQSGARPRAAASVVAALTGTRANDLYRALTGREPRK